MALTASQRNIIYQNFAPIHGEEVTEALLSQFPANDLQTPATRDFVRAECIALKSDVVHQIDQLRTDLTSEIEGVRTDLKAEIEGVRADLTANLSNVRAELKAEIGGVRTELKNDIGDLRTEMKIDIGDLRTDLQRELRLNLAATLTLVGALLTAFRLL